MISDHATIRCTHCNQDALWNLQIGSVDRARCPLCHGQQVPEPVLEEAPQVPYPGPITYPASYWIPARQPVTIYNLPGRYALNPDRPPPVYPVAWNLDRRGQDGKCNRKP